MLYAMCKTIKHPSLEQHHWGNILVKLTSCSLLLGNTWVARLLPPKTLWNFLLPIDIFIQLIMGAKLWVFMSHVHFSLWSMFGWPHHHRLTFSYVQYLVVPRLHLTYIPFGVVQIKGLLENCCSFLRTWVSIFFFE